MTIVPLESVIVAKKIDSIKFSMVSRNHYIIAKPIVENQVVTLTKHQVVKSIATIDDKVYNAFLAFYYSLMLGDSNGFYTSISNLSNALRNSTASMTTNQPMIKTSSFKVTPFRL
jgi:hypothetical protein